MLGRGPPVDDVGTVGAGAPRLPNGRRADLPLRQRHLHQGSR